MCLLTGAGAGLVCLNGLSAELGSGMYNLSTLQPGSNAVLNVYLVAMTLSNVLALVAGVWFLVLPTWAGTPVPLFFQISYGVICLLLVIFRQAGLLLEAIPRKGWCGVAQVVPPRPEDQRTAPSNAGRV